MLETSQEFENTIRKNAHTIEQLKFSIDENKKII